MKQLTIQGEEIFFFAALKTKKMPLLGAFRNGKVMGIDEAEKTITKLDRKHRVSKWVAFILGIWLF